MNRPSPSLPGWLRNYWLGIIALTAIAFAIVIIRGRWMGEGYPYNWLLLPPAHLFTDFNIYADRFLRYFGTDQFFSHPGHPFTYPAPVAIVYKLYYLLPNPLWMFLATLGAAALTMTALFSRELRRHGLSWPEAIGFATTSLILAYPLWFTIECANLEGIAWIAVTLGILAYIRERRWWAAALFGVAASMKLFPVMFLGLFFSKARYRCIVFGCSIAVTLTAISLWLVGPTMGAAQHGISYGLREFLQLYVYRVRVPETGFDHSLFAVVKQMQVLLWRLGVGWVPDPTYLQLAYSVYIVVVALTGMALFLGLVRKLPPLNQILALTICAVLFPPVSHDYTLIHLYLPWALVVLFLLRRRNAASTYLGWLIPFAILFTPQSYLLYDLTEKGRVLVTIGFAGQIKALALVALLLRTVTHSLTDSVEGSTLGCDAVQSKSTIATLS